MRKAVFGILGSAVLLWALPALSQDQAAAPVPETPAGFVERLQADLQKKDLPAYLRAFDEAARKSEDGRIRFFFDDLGMTGVVLRLAGVQTAGDGVTRAFVQAFFENDDTAVLQTWTLALAARSGSWSVAGLKVDGGLTRLYKLRIPSGRAARAKRVEVRDAGIRLTFSDAAVFYDNLPDIETALVVVGRGRLEFAPGEANEKHQLELLYKRDRIEEEVESLYIRGSSGFFAGNVVVTPDAGGRAVSPAELDKAAAVFARNYPRSFTIQSSINGGLLSFLPQGDEAVLEFKGRKTGEMAYIYYPFGEEEVCLYDHAKDRTVCLYSPEEPVQGAPLKRMTMAFSEKYDVSFYGLDLGFTPSSSRLSAKAHIEIVPNVDLLESVRFRFNTDLEILKIADAGGRELFYTVDKARKLLYVYFLDPAVAGVTTSIDVFYRGRMEPAAPTTDVIGQAGLNDRIRLRPRYETSFYTHAGFWYPGPADEDYFRARLTVTVPPEYQCIANGELVESGHREDMDDVAALEHAGNAVYTFVSRAPVKYLSFIVGKFDQKKVRPGAVPVSSFVSTEIMDSKPGLADQAAEILDFYAASFGPYPYEKLSIVTRLWPLFGGHSPASFVVLNEVPWLDQGFHPPADTPVDLSAWNGYFLAHEIAHQWWGHGVSFGSYKDQWLSEGLAQYSAASYLRRRYGDGAFAAILKKFARWTEKKSFRGPVVMGSRLSHFDYGAYQAIVYNKAAEALFMLRDLVGPEAFDAGLKSFFERHKFGTARTGEFMTAMENASGRGLRDFFQGWFYDWQLPDVRTAWTAAALPGGGARVELRVTQLKGRFVFPLWVEWTSGGRSGRTLVVVDEAVESFSLDLPAKPDRIRINPDRAVPGKFN